MTPQAAIDAIERDILIPSQPGEAFYGAIGLPFRSGHLLALLRRASPLGPAHTSIWHRDPMDRWTFYSPVAPERSCARYFGAQVDRNVITPINLEWTTPWTLRVSVGVELTWQVGLHSSPMTRLFNTIAPRIPTRVWCWPALLRGVSLHVDAAFGAGRMNLTGRTPNGHRFVINPRQLWLIDGSTAHVSGHDLGAPGPLEEPAALEDLQLPQRGLCAITSVRLEPRSYRPAPATSYGTACDSVLDRSPRSAGVQQSLAAPPQSVFAAPDGRSRISTARAWPASGRSRRIARARWRFL